MGTSASVDQAPASARLQRLGVAIIVSFLVIDGLLRALYFHFGARTEGFPEPLIDPLVAELTSSAAILVCFFAIVVPICRRLPLRGPRWRTHLGAYAVGLGVYSLLKTSLMWAQRALLWPLVGLGSYEYGDIGYRILMEGSLDVFGFSLLVAAVHVWDAWKEDQQRRLRESQLLAGLSEARLELLQAQLQPHFLYNTLNTISGVMYRDPEAADRLVSHLSDLLRASLRRDGGAEVTVAEEMGNLEHYLAIVRTRFGERLTVRTEVDPSAQTGRIPPLLLQPLVENAVRHTVGALAKPGHVDVSVRRRNGRLHVRVEDDGTGIPGDPQAAIGKGVGLTNTRDRLAWLHGERAELALSNAAQGGLVVELSFPFAEHGRPSEVVGQTSAEAAQRPETPDG